MTHRYIKIGATAVDPMIGESARWHNGRLWFAHWGTQEISAIGLDGTREVVGVGRPGLGWSIDWLPDGRLLFTQTTNGASALLWLDPSAPAVVHSISTGLMTAEHPAAAP